LSLIPSTDGSLIFEFEAAADRSYVLQVSKTLFPTFWTELAAVPAAATARTIRLTNAPPANAAGGFYRLVTP
jgi:hypothetical protein